MLSYILINARSLANKVDELALIVSMYKPKFLFITETWLTNKISSKDIYLDGYKILRCDRLSRKGGGVCVYVKDNINTICKSVLEFPSEVEYLSFISYNVNYILLYVPPQISATIKASVLDCLVRYCDEYYCNFPDGHVCILGDFNNHIWRDLCLQLDLSNIVTENTRLNATLDCVLISSLCTNKYTVLIRDPLSSSDHRMVFVYEQTKSEIKHVKKIVYDYRESYMHTFYHVLYNKPWDEFYGYSDANKAAHTLEDNIRDSLSVLPNKVVKLCSNDKPWITSNLKVLINKRWHAYKHRRFNVYHALKVKIKNEITQCKIRWANKIKSDNKSYWTIVKAERGKEDSLSSLSAHFESNVNGANHINTLLASVFQAPVEPIVIPDEPSHYYEPFTHQEVENTFVNLNYRKSYGNCGIPTKLFYMIFRDLVQPFTFLANLCLKQHTFPSVWKTADIVPVPKTSPPDLKKLRPISLLPLLGKVFEKLLLLRLKPLLLRNYDDCQYGFRPKSSTTCAIIKLRDKATRLLELPDVNHVSILSFDLAKAFDTVDHSVLLSKLKPIFTSQNIYLFHLIASFLCDRQQRVKFLSSYSSNLPIQSGVPQGSALSPYLFNFYISDLKSNNNACLVKFADDSTFVVPHIKNTTYDPVAAITSYITNWSQENNIRLNIDKTQIITISKKSNYRHHFPSNTALILGVTFNSKLKWNHHIDRVIKKCASRFYLIRKLRPILSKKELISVYFATIQSVIDYASPAFAFLPQYLEYKLERITKRAHYMICGFSCSQSCLPNPKSRRLILAKKLFTAAENDREHILHHIMPHRLPRSNHLFIEHSHTNRRIHEFIPYMSYQINMP